MDRIRTKFRLIIQYLNRDFPIRLVRLRPHRNKWYHTNVDIGLLGDCIFKQRRNPLGRVFTSMD